MADVLVAWFATPDFEATRRRRAYELAGILLEVPLASVHPVGAQRVRGGVGANFETDGEGSQPLSYELVGDYIPTLPPMRPPQSKAAGGEEAGASGPDDIGGPGENKVRAARSARMARRKTAGLNPGAGGRRPRQTPYTQTTATAELYELLGMPEEYSFGTGKMLVWIKDPAGDGIVAAASRLRMPRTAKPLFPKFTTVSRRWKGWAGRLG